MRTRLGRMNTLTILKEVEFGLYLDGGEFGEILLPRRYVPSRYDIGESLSVFVYLDSKDRLVATTDKPLAQIGEVAFLRVKDVNRTGAFMDWGMPKDLLVPFAEQRVPMQKGRTYAVFLYEDSSGRIAASSKLSLHLPERNSKFKAGEAVDLLVVSQSQMGFTAVINGTHLGLIHESELVRPLKVGQKLHGFIKNIRPDRKINLALNPQGKAGKDVLVEQVLAHLKANNGESGLTDHASPEAIFAVYKVSKGKYKKALSQLYKERKIVLEPNRVRLS